MENIDVESCENENTIELSENEHNLEIPLVLKSKNVASKESEKAKLTKLPLSRVRGIMKMDPDCQIISQEALFLVAKATELFLENLAKETFKCTLQGKRKTVLKKDLDMVINLVPNLCFLDGSLDRI